MQPDEVTNSLPPVNKVKPSSVLVRVTVNAGFEKCATVDQPMTNDMEGIFCLLGWSPESKKNIDKIFTKHKFNEVVYINEALDVTPKAPDSGCLDES